MVGNSHCRERMEYLLDRDQLLSTFFSSFITSADEIHGHLEDDSSFDLFDYFHAGDEDPPPAMKPRPAASPDLMARNSEPNTVLPAFAENTNIRDDDELQPETKKSLRVAFRTQTEVDVLDDGFKWRKYGKKSVKNRPNNPRNYYRCSSERCPVKKRVERDQEDPSYVITTYIGSHNHTSPVVQYYGA